LVAVLLTPDKRHIRV